MTNNISFNYTLATITAIVGAFIAVLVTFGFHFTEDNTRAVLVLVGAIGGSISAGGGAKSAALIHANIKVPEWLHFTPATILSAVGAILTIGATYVFHVSQENTQSILYMVGLLASGITVGGGVKSNAMIRAGWHPALNRAARRT